MGRLAIVAGGGELPSICLKNAIQMGEDPLLLSIVESDFQLHGIQYPSHPIHIGKIQTILKICRKEKIQRILLVGKLRKDLLFKGLKLDWKAVSILAKSLNQNDYPIFQAVAQEFQKQGIQFESQKKYCKNCLLPAGRYTKKSLTQKEYEDVAFGMEYAKKIADWDIGQTVVVYDKTVIAVEAVEGTDETIRRAGKLLHPKKKGVVCKSSKSTQDERFDLPTVGIETLKAMAESGCHTLAIQENDTVVVNPQACIEFAEKHKIHFISFGNHGKKTNNQYKKPVL